MNRIGFFRDDMCLPRRPYLNITMKKIKLTRKEAAEETRQAHHMAALSSPGSHAGLESLEKSEGGLRTFQTSDTAVSSVHMVLWTNANTDVSPQEELIFSLLAWLWR